MRNRGFFVERLTESLARVDYQPGRAFAVLFFDLDRFKIVNDSLGHRVGDLLLQEIAKRIDDCVRPEDVAARMGGDEFAVLVDTIRAESSATELADRIIARLREPVVLNDLSIAVQASVGIAYRPVDGLLRRACCATPISRCTARSSTAAIGTHFSMTRCTHKPSKPFVFRPEVVDRDRDAERVETLEQVVRASRIFEEYVLRNL